jgi:hypothetical protein
MSHDLAGKSRPILYMTPAGYTDRRPADYPALNRAALMRLAHATAKRQRSQFSSYRQALAFGLTVAWGSIKVAREFQSLRAQTAPVQHTPAQITASRAATRRAGSSLWAS